MKDLPDDEKSVEVPALPPHWDFGGEVHPIQLSTNPIMFLHQYFCAISFGCASVQTVWRKSHTSEWRDMRDGIKDRLQHMNLVASLLLTTIASFCTTEPPAGSRILPYTNVIPYCFLLSSWAFAVAALVVGGASAFSVHKMSPVWFREVLMASKRRIWITTFILSLPFTITVLSFWSLAFGMAIAAISSEITFIQYGPILFGLPPFISWAACIWMAFFRPEALWRFWKHLTC